MAYINNITVGSVNYDLALPTQSVGDGLTISTNEADDSSILSVDIGNGLYFNEKKLSIKPSSGITCDNNGVSLKVNTDIFNFNNNKLGLNLGSGLMHDEGNGIPRVKLGTGLQFNKSNGNIQINCGDGIDYYTETDDFGNQNTKLCVKIGDGLQLFTGKIEVKLGRGLNIDTNGAICNPIQYGDGLDATDNTLSVATSRGLKFDDNKKLEIYLDSNYGDGLTFDKDYEHTHLRMRRHASLTMHRTNINDGLLGNLALGVNESWLKQFIQDNFNVTSK